MQFVKAQDLKVGDRLIMGDKSHRVDDVAVSQVNVAVRSATYPVPVLHSRGTEVLIEDRVPVVTPEPTPPAPQWHVRYHRFDGDVMAALMHGDTPVRHGSWGDTRSTESEALDRLLQLWGKEIEAKSCTGRGCYRPRIEGSRTCGQAACHFLP